MAGSLHAAALSVLLLFVLAACSSGKHAGNDTARATGTSGSSAQEAPASPAKPPAGSNKAASIGIAPVNATRESVLHLTAKGINIAGAETEWIVNGIPVAGAEGPSFKTDGTSKGDQVEARVTVQGKEFASNVVEIHDAPPVITKIRITPEVFRPGDRLGVDVKGKDPDGDEVTMRYQWTKNGEPAGDGREIDGEVKRGDKIEVRIVPFDGDLEGTAVVLKREIANIPPMIEKGGRFNFDGTVCTYQTRATDPDGDTLAYSLKGAPPGMEIDPETGLVRWNVPPDFTGKASFTVVVKDGHGGESTQALTFSVQ